jgi:hypothetical protein
MLAALTDLRRSAHGRHRHWATLLNIRPNKMSSVAFAKAKLRKNATVAGGSGVAIRSCVSIATRTSGHETSATMATRIILANACCGKRREQRLSDNGSPPSRSIAWRAPSTGRRARGATHQRAANAAVPGARGHDDASGRAAQFCQELPVDARPVFKTSVRGKNDICLVHVN